MGRDHKKFTCLLFINSFFYLDLPPIVPPRKTLQQSQQFCIQQPTDSYLDRQASSSSLSENILPALIPTPETDDESIVSKQTIPPPIPPKPKVIPLHNNNFLT